MNVRSARAPLDVYLAFLDTPDVTVAAARFLKIANYDVRALDDDCYSARAGLAPIVVDPRSKPHRRREDDERSLG